MQSSPWPASHCHHTQQIHVAKQKHAFIQHPFDKRQHEMHSILLNHNDKIFQLPALLCFSTEEKFQYINTQFQKHQIIGLKYMPYLGTGKSWTVACMAYTHTDSKGSKAQPIFGVENFEKSNDLVHN